MALSPNFTALSFIILIATTLTETDIILILKAHRYKRGRGDPQKYVQKLPAPFPSLSMKRMPSTFLEF